MEVLNTTLPTVSDSAVSNSKICSIPCSSSETNNIVSSDTSHQPSVSPSDSSLRTSAQSVSSSTSTIEVTQSVSSDSSATDSNQLVSSTFIPAPDPRGFDGGDMLRMKR